MNARTQGRPWGLLPRLALLALLGWAAPAGGQSPPGISLEPQNEGLSIRSRFDAVLAHTTPAYVSLDQPRAVTLLYSSAQAEPRPLVQVDATPAAGEVPEKLSISLRDASGTRVRLANGSTENFYAAGSGQTQRLAAQLDASALPTGAYTYTVAVRSWQGRRFAEASAPVRVLVVNERQSPFGAGWSLPGLQRLHVQADSSVVITEGDGSAAYFAYTGCTLDAFGIHTTCNYAAPKGDFSRLSLNPTEQRYYRTYPGGGSAKFRPDGRQEWLLDRDGIVRSFYHDSAGVLRRISDRAGLGIDLAYDTAGRLATIEDPAGRVTHVEADRTGKVVRIIDPDSVPALRMHYAGSRLAQYWDRRGSGFGLSYDWAGRLSASTLPQITTADGTAVRPATRYRSWAAAVLPDSGRGTFPSPADARLPSGLRAEITNPKANVTRLALDRWNAPTRVEEPFGRVSLAGRTEHGRVERTISPAADTVDYAYDATGTDLLTVTERRTGRVITMTYTPDHRLRTSTGGAQSIENEYELDDELPDFRGDLIFSRVGSEANYYEYFSNRLEFVYGPAGSQHYHYAPDGWLNTDSTVAADGSRVAYGYDSAGRVRVIRNAFGDSVRFEYDALNRLRRSLDAAGNATIYEYDVVDLVRVTDAKGQTYTTDHNALGWVTSRTDPLGRSEILAYDVNGNLVRHTNRRGQAVEFGYDALDRLLWRDADGKRTTYAHDPLGTWTAASNGESTDTLRTRWGGAGTGIRFVDQVAVRGGQRHRLESLHDEHGVRINVHAAEPAALDYSVTHEYHRADESYRPRTISDLAGSTTSVLFTDSIRLGRVAFPTADTVFTRATSVRYSDPAVDRAIGVWYELDALDRVVERGTTVAAGDSLRSFDFDRVGRLVLREDTLVTQQEVCEPDPVLGQICSMQPVPGFLDRSAYAYDAVGNRTDSGAQVEEGNRLEAFGGYALEHDLDGNVTRKSLAADSLAFDQRLHWNSLGQLDSVRTVRQGVGSTVAYGYDGWDRRVRRTTNAGTARYVYDGSQIALEVDGSGNVVAEYSYFPGVDQPHTVKRGGSVYYYLADGPGNVVGLLDASGTLVNEYHYSPWGEAEVEREGVAQPYRFTGRTWDRETGLYDYRARWYDPALGRFVSEDPIGLAGGINPYAYVGNDPVNGRDPSGLSECWRVSGWGAGVAVNGPGGQVLGHTDASGDFTNCRGGDQQFGTLWTHHLFGSAAYGRPGSLTDPADEEAFWQAEQQAREDQRKGELLARAVRSMRGTADMAAGLTPQVSTAGDAYPQAILLADRCRQKVLLATVNAALDLSGGRVFYQALKGAAEIAPALGWRYSLGIYKRDFVKALAPGLAPTSVNFGGALLTPDESFNSLDALLFMGGLVTGVGTGISIIDAGFTCSALLF